MTNANWQPVKNIRQCDWRQSVQDIECELSGAKCKVFVVPHTSGEYDTDIEEVEWAVERVENSIQVLDMSGCIITSEITLKEDFELAKKRAEAFARCWGAPERIDLFFNKWERGIENDWMIPREERQWKANTPHIECRVDRVTGRVWAEKDKNGLKRIKWVVSLWEHTTQGLVWALRVSGTIYTNVFDLINDYELGKRRANEFALCWVKGNKK